MIIHASYIKTQKQVLRHIDKHKIKNNTKIDETNNKQC